MKVMSMEPGSGGPQRAATPIALGTVLLVVAGLIVSLLPAWVAAIVLGILAAAVTCYVVLMVVPRNAQIAFMGAAIGVSADAGYAKVTEAAPVTIANALVEWADSLMTAIGLISASSGVNVTDVAKNFVWAFILAIVMFMGLSFLVKHDG